MSGGKCPGEKCPIPVKIILNTRIHEYIDIRQQREKHNDRDRYRNIIMYEDPVMWTHRQTRRQRHI